MHCQHSLCRVHRILRCLPQLHRRLDQLLHDSAWLPVPRDRTRSNRHTGKLPSLHPSTAPEPSVSVLHTWRLMQGRDALCCRSGIGLDLIYNALKGAAIRISLEVVILQQLQSCLLPHSCHMTAKLQVGLLNAIAGPRMSAACMLALRQAWLSGASIIHWTAPVVHGPRYGCIITPCLERHSRHACWMDKWS